MPGIERAMMAARTLMAAIKNTQRRTNFQLQRGLPRCWLPSLLIFLVVAELLCSCCDDSEEEFEAVSISIDTCRCMYCWGREGGWGAKERRGGSLLGHAGALALYFLIFNRKGHSMHDER